MPAPIVPQPALRPWLGSAGFQVEGATVDPKGMSVGRPGVRWLG